MARFSHSLQSRRFGRFSGSQIDAILLLLGVSLYLVSAPSAAGGYEHANVKHKLLRGSQALRGARVEWQPDPSRVVQISTQPRAFVYHGFLSDAECDHLIALSEPKLFRPGTQANATFLRKFQDVDVRAIEDRISAWLFLPRKPTDPQLMRYNTGQQFDVHYDYFQHKEDRQVLHRAATLVLFLSDVEWGGEVTFPNGKPEREQDFGPVSDCARGKIAVRPRKGDALLYFHLTADGYSDPSAYREDCPVLPQAEPKSAVETGLGALFRGVRGSTGGATGSDGSGIGHLNSRGKRRGKRGDGSNGGDAEGMKWTAEKWVHMFKYMTRRSLLDCTDEHPNCGMWAAGGECKRNPGYMVGEGGYVGNCRKSCKACSN
ncbi:hypothetical protein CLOM_g5450 [Closterium sp. NIES-68]|nr:hypothetical protein CLOM_g5450 [Closterium sp. NIES-68]GJP61080.1 hypothetical protein CLOP_g18287 [Closterium sp. NIES-67]